ncbi:sulfotransferase domain-containing protein [Alkalihalobacterium elongatum]|uniref:sulfotransferase domain-containing protein n=1 Tax=Alkalihalobacterium elongatum TaxID=2675466 RepID=UPI001C200B24|nr:sulfotransferase domain-containing protein [Alkalihalobacterium elongatum]
MLKDYYFDYEQTNQLPDFLIIGAQKSGTTSLFRYIIQHPNVIPAVKKEIHFFNNPDHFNKGIDWYKAQFPQLDKNEISITGEATPNYLEHSHIPKKVFKLMPNVKLIVILRNPVDRVYSNYHYRIKRGLENLSFEQVISNEEKLIKKGKTTQARYLYRGFYAEHLKEWMRYFPKEQFLILQSEEFFKDPSKNINQLISFLELPSSNIETSRKYNVGKYSPMYEETRNRLNEFYKPHNDRLCNLLGRNFGWNY